jgi:alkanesulfonate monooxygenase SsuD/methylene tetrahydromethanopterin reductase-like flavin-dependent oxidoreductase (luciferase family)
MASKVFAPGSVSLRIYPHNDLPATGVVDTIMDQAARAERAGFDGIMTAEHHGGFGGYLPNPLQAAGWALEVMQQGWAAACPMLMTLRPTNLVAEEVAWQAARFPGRVGFGAGAGSLEEDFRIMDQEKEGYIQRFKDALPVITRILAGGDAGLLAGDPAILRLKDHPIHVLSATSSPGGCRSAGACGAGIIVDNNSVPSFYRDRIQGYRDAGGRAPVVLIRNVWIGDYADIRQRELDQMALYHTYANQDHMTTWTNDAYISGTPSQVAQRLAAALRESGAESLNIRMHLPGIGPAEIADQIDAFGEVLPLFHRDMTETMLVDT